MNFMGFLTIVSLAITGTICTVGVFSSHYNDTLLQRIGLSGLAMGCFLRIPTKLEDPFTPPALLMAQLSIALYAIGCVLKLRKKARERLRGGKSPSHFHRRATD